MCCVVLYGARFSYDAVVLFFHQMSSHLIHVFSHAHTCAAVCQSTKYTFNAYAWVCLTHFYGTNDLMSVSKF